MDPDAKAHELAAHPVGQAVQVLVEVSNKYPDAQLLHTLAEEHEVQLARAHVTHALLTKDVPVEQAVHVTVY